MQFHSFVFLIRYECVGFVLTYLCVLSCQTGLKRVISVLYNRPIIEMDKLYIQTLTWMGFSQLLYSVRSILHTVLLTSEQWCPLCGRWAVNSNIKKLYLIHALWMYRQRQTCQVCRTFLYRHVSHLYKHDMGLFHQTHEERSDKPRLCRGGSGPSRRETSEESFYKRLHLNCITKKEI